MLNDGHQRQQHPHLNQVNMLPESVRNITGYPSPAEPPQSMPPFPDTYDHPPPFDGMYMSRREPTGRPAPTSLRIDTSVVQTTTTDGTRTFPCTTCGKGFARRSDLARHGRFCPSFILCSRLNGAQSGFTLGTDHTSVLSPDAASHLFKGLRSQCTCECIRERNRTCASGVARSDTIGHLSGQITDP